MLKVYPILCRAGKMDNYAYLLIDEASKISAILDASEATPIEETCNSLNIKPEYILTTHHHFDHTDANLILKEKYKCQIVGNKADFQRIPGIDICVECGQTFSLGESKAEIIDASAHTQGHILWYFAKDKILFTGDTLFNLCIGGLFEGSAEEMFNVLQKIKSLPDDVKFYPGHEYTLYGAKEALELLPHEPMVKEYIKQAQNKLAQGQPVAPITLGMEKLCNPYLRAKNVTELQQII